MSSSLPTLLRQSTQEASTPTSLHLLPFHISYSGPAKVSNYFPIQVVKQEDNNDSNEEPQRKLYRSYFRGRMLVGTEVELPTGYSGQLWKSNAPSVSVNTSNSRASTSKARDSTSIDYSSVEYNADSPRRSPRKHASVNVVNASSSNGKGKTTTAASTNAKGKKKVQPKKRQRFAMSPDASPVKESASTTAIFEEALDKAAASMGIVPSTTEEATDTVKEHDADDSLASEEAIQVATSPAKKRAKLELEEAFTAKAEESSHVQDGEMKVDPSSADVKTEEEMEASIVMTAEATSTTIVAGGETITSTTVKLERASTPPPAPASSAPLIPPSTPVSSSDVIPINIISPRTPNTPSGSKLLFSPQIQIAREEEEEEDDLVANQGPIHEKIIQPIGRFDKITIWNPDMELDRGDDCYVKALDEWTRLAELIHS